MAEKISKLLSSIRNYFPSDLTGYETGFMAVTANFTITPTDGLWGVLADSANSTITITLPAAASSDGRILYILNIDASEGYGGRGNVVVDGNGSETINGSASKTLEGGESGVYICNGSEWFYIWGTA